MTIDFARSLGRDLLTLEDLGGQEFPHPVTGIDYIRYYQKIIREAGATPRIILCNDPRRILDYEPDAVIAADIHSRARTCAAISTQHPRCITLDQLCNSGAIYSEWGLLGSNISAGEKIKLAPREGPQVVTALQRQVQEKLGVAVEVMIYGDGAARLLASELADLTAVAAGLIAFVDQFCLADQCTTQSPKCCRVGSSAGRAPGGRSLREQPPGWEDIVASLCLVSGSSDAGTPLVVVKG